MDGWVAEEIMIQRMLRRDDCLPCGTVRIGRRFLAAYKQLFGLPVDAVLTHIYGMRVVEVEWDEFLQVTE